MSVVTVTVNGKAVTADVEPRLLLVQFLRENLRLTGTHVGCDTSQCGACVVHVNGKAIKSCTALAWLATARASRPSKAWHAGEAASDAGGVPRTSRAAVRLLHAGHDHVGRRYRAPQGRKLDEKTIRDELEGNICRCTGYHNIVKAVPPARARWRTRHEHGSGIGGAMSATGIGQPVRRREDIRFITGSGQYTDDINRPGQSYAVFVRSPHAHAKVGAIAPEPQRIAGRARRVHRQGFGRRQDRHARLRLDDPFQGRLADEAGRIPPSR
jgi:carbon-monoxide dehydrogenase small subunit